MKKLLFLFVLLAAAPVHAIKPGRGLTEVPDHPRAPDFSLPDIDGEKHSLSDYRGKVLIVNFWATWCPPCRAEMPSMERAWKRYQGRGLVIVAVNVGEGEDAIFQFTAEHPVTFPIVLDEDSKVVTDWGVRGLPTTFVVDPQGRVVYRAIGGREWDDPALLDKVMALASSTPKERERSVHPVPEQPAGGGQ